jgi:tyrosine-protein kinase Etk/Wzc
LDDEMNEPLLAAPRAAPMPYENPGAFRYAFLAGITPYRKYFDIIWSRKISIALATCLCALVGALYASLASPVYKASILVQINDTPPPTDRVLGESSKASGLAEATAPELGVLRSRWVVSRAVDSLRLFIDVRPRYLPVVGEWLAARHEGLSKPSLFGMGGYVWGSENATVSQFDVPAKLLDSRFVLTTGPDHTYTLANDEAGLRLSGRVGEPARLATPRGEIALTVTSLQAQPGAQFILQRFARLESIERLQHALKIAEQDKQSGVIGIALEGSDPERLARILNEIGSQYIRQNEERHSAGAEKSLAFLERQLPALKQAVETAEASYNQMRNHFGSIDLGEEAKGLLQLAVTAQTRLMDLTQKRTELTVRYENAHPVMVTVNQQISALNRELAGLNARIRRLPQIEQDIVRLNRDVKVSTDVYTAVLSNAQQLRLSAANRVGNASVLDAAEIPVRPIRPRPFLIVGAAALLGLLLGILAACARTVWQCRVDEPLDVEQQLGLTVTAAIPHSAGQQSLSVKLAGSATLSGPALLQLSMPEDGAVESLRRLRFLLQRAPVEVDNHVIVITGPSAGVGKSFVAANLAAVLASAGKAVLLVDADLRTGHLHRAFAAHRGPGLAEYLAGGFHLEQITRANVLPRIDLIPTGAPPSDPAELLSHDRLRELLRSASSRYDYVLVDTAPVLPVSDALPVAALGAATLNVVRSGVTTAVEIDETTRQLRQAGANMAGVVVNGFRSRSPRYGYGTAYDASAA